MRSTLVLLLLARATPALATDGVLEINQTCAMLTGCVSGDADRPFCLALDLPHPTQDRPGFVRNRAFTHSA